MTAVERKSHFELTTDTAYLTLMGGLLGVYYEKFEKSDRVTTAPHWIWVEDIRELHHDLICL